MCLPVPKASPRPKTGQLKRNFLPLPHQRRAQQRHLEAEAVWAIWLVSKLAELPINHERLHGMHATCRQTKLIHSSPDSCCSGAGVCAQRAAPRHGLRNDNQRRAHIATQQHRTRNEERVRRLQQTSERTQRTPSNCLTFSSIEFGSGSSANSLRNSRILLSAAQSVATDSRTRRQEGSSTLT